MLSSWAWRGCDRRLSLGAAPVALAVLVLTAAPARALPIDDPHPGGIGFSGPTTGDLAAVYWNPAALGLMHGPQLLVASTLSLTTTTVQRASINPATGAPGPGQEFPAARASGVNHPFS